MAFKIVEDVTAQVALLRGRIGAFQKTQIEANKENMVDAIEIETGARSEIADANFAEEASNMSRYQLLMQSNITVLQQSTQTRQLLLSLLQG
jgi:flagellin